MTYSLKAFIFGRRFEFACKEINLVKGGLPVSCLLEVSLAMHAVVRPLERLENEEWRCSSDPGGLLLRLCMLS
jgi:hypothetical protein